jgi:hypothetical protein
MKIQELINELLDKYKPDYEVYVMNGDDDVKILTPDSIHLFFPYKEKTFGCLIGSENDPDDDLNVYL